MINSNVDQAHVYTEFSGLHALKSQAKHDKTAALETVSKQFEAMFISMITKSMREANKVFSEGNLLQSSETEFYQQMFDSQLSLTLSEGRGVGLSEAMMRQMSRQIDGVESTETTNPLLHKSISDYPRALHVQKPLSDAVALADSIIEVEETIARVDVSQSDQTLSNNPEQVMNNKAVNHSPLSFSSPDEFISYLYPMALKAEEETGISAKVMLAQSALETGWGKHMVNSSESEPSFNLFGIKADQRWDGERVEIVTTEYRDGVPMKEKAAFRSYQNYEESFKDYASFLQQNHREVHSYWQDQNG